MSVQKKHAGRRGERGRDRQPYHHGVQNGAQARTLAKRDPQKQHHERERDGHGPEIPVGLLCHSLREHRPRRVAERGEHEARLADAEEPEPGKKADERSKVGTPEPRIGALHRQAATSESGPISATERHPESPIVRSKSA